METIRCLRVQNYYQKCFWTFFPYFYFFSCLALYAVLGAIIFSSIEGSRDEKNADYEAFLEKLWAISESNQTETKEEKKKHFIMETRKLMKQFKNNWLLNPEEWSFLGSLFFCLTVLTTVGYGYIYPLTKLGRYVCILYALFGIPLMFLVMTAIGDDLAKILSKSYNKFKSHHFFTSQYRKLSCRCLGNRKNACKHINQVSPSTVSDIADFNNSGTSGTVRSLKKHSNNLKLFEKFIKREKENMQYLSSSQIIGRSISCPVVAFKKTSSPRTPNLKKIGKEIDKLNVPIPLITLIVIAYISLGAAILPIWETQMNFETAFYFYFITFTTIGFGDIKLNETTFFMFSYIYVIIGMEIFFITFRLVQNRLYHAYQIIVSFVTKKNIY